MKRLKFFISNQKLIIKHFSSKLNIRPYDRLDKEIADFKEHKDKPAVLYNTKFLYYWNGEDLNNNKRCKTHI